MRDDDEQPSMFARLRTLPTAVQVSGVFTVGVVVIDLMRSLKDIVLSIIQLVKGIGSCS
jgi:hypothetical protein